MNEKNESLKIAHGEVQKLRVWDVNILAKVHIVIESLTPV